MSQIPGFARKVRAVLDWTASLPFKRDIAEVGSIGAPNASAEPPPPLADGRQSASMALLRRFELVGVHAISGSVLGSVHQSR